MKQNLISGSAKIAIDFLNITRHTLPLVRSLENDRAMLPITPKGLR